MKNPYLKDELKYFLHTFQRQPIQVARAKGAFVWDAKGRKYFDFYSGLAVCGVGHNNARVVRAIRAQAGRLLHSSNFFYTAPQFALAKALTARLPGSRVFFSNSGAEANELAIKLARLWAHRAGKPGRTILTFHNAFHGRTLATAAASVNPARTYDEFAPLPGGFRSVPFNDLAAASRALGDDAIAVLIEPVQGEGGIQIAEPAFFEGLADLCRRRDLLLLVDEIQSGLGRTGRFFAHEHYGVKPDVVTLAKGLAGGLPLGATLAMPGVAQHVKPGLHGSTFGGNPVSCAASLEVIKLLSPSAIRSIRKTGERLTTLLSRFFRYPTVKSLRSLGLMIGLELTVDGAPYVDLARERGLLINCTQGRVLRFLPPYFISGSELSRCVSILQSVFDALAPVKARETSRPDTR